MFAHLQIADARERALVGLADLGLTIAGWPLRWRTGRTGAPRRILLLRLERIGDLLMSLGAIRAVRRLAPDACIDLVVGSWNEAIASTVAEVDRIEVLDAPWLARGGTGNAAAALAARSLSWRRQRFDLAINFEGDIRSHLLVAGSLARRRVGFDMAGGGPLLSDRVAYDPRRHTAENSLALVERAFGLERGTLPGPLSTSGAPGWRLTPTAAARDAAAARLLAARGPVVAVHVPGGRAVKQWPVERFAEAARELALRHGATVLLTGAPGDEPIVAPIAEALAPSGPVINVAGALDLLTLAAVLERCDVLVTGDTGPMHLAAAVGTPVVAVFGPSDPARYAPLVEPRYIVRVDLPCAPCNRVRRPPERCTGHTADCLRMIGAGEVAAAASAVLASVAPGRRR